jgi:hypothetical protein
VSELITRAARLAPYAKRPRQATGFVTAYTYEPHPEEETAGMGNLFLVIEVISSGRMAEEVANLVIDTISGHYYDVGGDGSRSHLDRFEAAIKATNAELNHYIDQGNAAWVGKLSAIVAIQAGDELHLTQTGSAEAFLSRGKASTRITAAPGPNGPQPNKTFGAITSGDLEAGDRLLLATPALVHQLPLDKLRTIIASTTPTGAVAEITGLLDGASSMRVAALVVEVTTPEQAALQMRGDEPNDVVLNPGDTPLDLARQAAAPLAQTAVASSKKLRDKAAKSIESAKPHARRATLWGVKNIRTFLTAKGKERRLTITGVILIIIVATIIITNLQHSTANRLNARYQADLSGEESAAAMLINGDKTTAETKLSAIQADLSSLASSKSAPRGVASLQQKISQLLDQAENLQRVTASTVATFPAKTPSPTHFELIGLTQAVTVDGAGSAIQVVNLTNGSLKRSAANTSQLGTVVATSLNSAGDGIYILTKAPAVWLYKPAGDSLSKQAVAESGVPASLAISGFNGNLYFLGNDSSVQKAVRTLAGFGPAAVSLSPATNTELAGATAMTVDGSVYVISNKGLLQYISGQLQQSVTVPTSLRGAAILRSIGDGTTLNAVSPTTGRIGLFSYTVATTLVFTKQFAINGSNHILDATTNPTTRTVYALADNKLVKFSLQ